jgi:hypothetical protein
MKPPLCVEQDEPETPAYVDYDRAGTSVSWLQQGRATSDRINESPLPPYCVPPIVAVLGPVMISRDKEATRPGAGDYANLGGEVHLGGTPFDSIGRGKPTRIDVVSQKNHHRF